MTELISKFKWNIFLLTAHGVTASGAHAASGVVRRRKAGSEEQTGAACQSKAARRVRCPINLVQMDLHVNMLNELHTITFHTRVLNKSDTVT